MGIHRELGINENRTVLVIKMWKEGMKIKLYDHYTGVLHVYLAINTEQLCSDPVTTRFAPNVVSMQSLLLSARWLTIRATLHGITDTLLCKSTIRHNPQVPYHTT